MKKYVITLIVSVFVAISGAVNAQLVKQKTKVEEKNQVDRDWYNCSFEKDGVYGACVNEAYEFLKGKKVKGNVSFYVSRISMGMWFVMGIFIILLLPGRKKYSHLRMPKNLIIIGNVFIKNLVWHRL